MLSVIANAVLREGIRAMVSRRLNRTSGRRERGSPKRISPVIVELDEGTNIKSAQAFRIRRRRLTYPWKGDMSHDRASEPHAGATSRPEPEPQTGSVPDTSAAGRGAHPGPVELSAIGRSGRAWAHGRWDELGPGLITGSCS